MPGDVRFRLSHGWTGFQCSLKTANGTKRRSALCGRTNSFAATATIKTKAERLVFPPCFFAGPILIKDFLPDKHELREAAYQTYLKSVSLEKVLLRALTAPMDFVDLALAASIAVELGAYQDAEVEILKSDFQVFRSVVCRFVVGKCQLILVKEFL